MNIYYINKVINNINYNKVNIYFAILVTQALGPGRVLKIKVSLQCLKVASNIQIN